jgi:hypothetical protein
MMNRRTFLKSSSTAVVAAALGGRLPVGFAGGADSPVFVARLVPEGAEAVVAFASDHHYWPDHPENWGGGAQITSNCDRRMPDFIEVLNAEHPDVSVHAGDVISAGGSFFPPPEEYAKQLAFAKQFYAGLNHPVMPLIGNHETLEAKVSTNAQFEPWVKHFGPAYRVADLKGWRIIGLNCIFPTSESGAGAGEANPYGLDRVQFAWLRDRLREAADRKLKVIVCAHVPPAQWSNAAEFERALVESGCVKAVLCGHTHKNQRLSLGGIPVLVRIANVCSPLGYSMLHLYPDGRIIVVQKSQHFPYDDFISSGFQAGAQGSESDRYLTVGGSSELPLHGLKVVGAGARAAIEDGHLRLTSGEGRAVVLINAAALSAARLSLTVTKASGNRIGGIALAGEGGEGGIEATLTSLYSPDGKVFLARASGGRREVLARSWFNIADNIAYRLVLEVRNGQISASWKNMVNLKADASPAAPGLFGFFVDRGTAFVTDLKLERLTSG